jgi:hypothetical protein
MMYRISPRLMLIGTKTAPRAGPPFCNSSMTWLFVTSAAAPSPAPTSLAARALVRRGAAPRKFAVEQDVDQFLHRNVEAVRLVGHQELAHADIVHSKSGAL